ncbi:hypothetical protein [Devriesea agamarum]|uniref:hypothetical protein n=1 Tax=Devriesea agamarum TaxID=472569 RepID=UPI00071C7391|nr:hypothetical protein [Devriesea agamarum]
MPHETSSSHETSTPAPLTSDATADSETTASGSAHSKAAPRTQGRSIAGVGLASLFSAAVMYLAMYIGARVYDSTTLTYLLLFISAYQLVTGLLAGVTTELTRSVAKATTMTSPQGPRVATVALVVAAALGVLAAVSLPLWKDQVFAVEPLLLGGLVCLTAVGFAAHAATAGALSGRGDWNGLSGLLTLEAGVRGLLTLLAAGAAVMIGLGIGGFAGAMALASFSWVAMMLFSARARAAFASRTDVPAGALGRKLGASVSAQVSNALLTAGFPTLLALMTSQSQVDAAAGLILAISLTRAPLIIPLSAFQSVLITYFVRASSRPAAMLAVFGGGIIAVGAVGSGLAWLIGPWIMTFFRQDVSGGLLAALTGAATLLAALVLTGALCQALGRHTLFLAGWAAAVLAALASLALPGTIDYRAVVALVAGPLVGILIMLPGVLRPAQERQLVAEER